MSLIFESIPYLVLAFWILLALDRRRRWPGESEFLMISGGPAAVSARVAAVVPARNEAAVLAETLPALLAQEHEEFQVYLVDDRSDDGTASVARQVAATAERGSRLEVLDAPAPEPGWSGKLNALEAGVKASARDDVPEWYLFTDADIRHPPKSVTALLEKARGGEFDLVSVMARLHARSFWERLLIPAFVFFFQILYPFRLVARVGSRVAAAAGGCVLVRRSALESAGGIEAIRGAVIDDVALARSIRDAGGRLWLGLDPEIVSVRAYQRLEEIWKMIARCAFVQLRQSYALLVCVLLGLFVFFVSPPIVVVSGLLGGGSDVTLPAVLAWTLQTLALYPSVQHHRVPAAYSLLLPLASLLYGLMTLSSAWRHFRGRGIEWRGRNVALGLSDE